MRLPALAVLALLLAGCGGPSPARPGPAEDGGDSGVLPGDVPTDVDSLSGFLDPASNAFQEFLVVEDNLSLPGGGWMEFQTGRGMHCAGNADPVAPGATGWISCLARLVAKPSAYAQGVHELGIGFDNQRLSLRLAAEPIEWRVLVQVAGNGSVATAYDSGWRPVDLSPTVTEPVLQVTVTDPCDDPSTTEDSPTTSFQERSGAAVLLVNFSAAHGAPFVDIDLGRSVPLAATSIPFAGHGTGEHGLVATYPPFGAGLDGSLELHVDLEAADEPQELQPGGPCTLAVSSETQSWTVKVGVVGADGRMQFLTRTVDVLVHQSAT